MGHNREAVVQGASDIAADLDSAALETAAHEGLQLQKAKEHEISVKIVIEDTHQFQGNIWLNIISQF